MKGKEMNIRWREAGCILIFGLSCLSGLLYAQGNASGRKFPLKKGDAFTVWCASLKPPVGIQCGATDSLGRGIWYAMFKVLDVKQSDAGDTKFRVNVTVDKFNAEALYSWPTLELKNLKINNQSIDVVDGVLLEPESLNFSVPVILNGMNCSPKPDSWRMRKRDQWWQEEKMLSSKETVYRYGRTAEPTSWLSPEYVSDWPYRSAETPETVALQILSKNNISRIVMTREDMGFWWQRALSQAGKEEKVAFKQNSIVTAQVTSFIPSVEHMECCLFETLPQQKEKVFRPKLKKGTQFTVRYRSYGIRKVTAPPPMPSWSKPWYAHYEITNVEQGKEGLIEVQATLSGIRRGKYRIYYRKNSLSLVSVYSIDEKRTIVRNKTDTTFFGTIAYPAGLPFLYETPALPSDGKSIFSTRKVAASEVNKYDEMIRFINGRVEVDLFIKRINGKDRRLVMSWNPGDPFWTKALYTIGGEPRLEAILLKPK